MEYLQRLAEWTLSFAHSDWASASLFLLAFAESSFFPIPPDLLLIALTLGHPGAWIWFAAVCTAGSAAGGLGGYALGHWGGRPLLQRLVSPARIVAGERLLNKYDVAAIAVAGFTPIPYKVFTIAAGVLRLRIGRFFITSVFSRGARFFLVAGLIALWGEAAGDFVRDYFEWLTLALAAAAVLGYAVYRKMSARIPAPRHSAGGEMKEKRDAEPLPEVHAAAEPTPDFKSLGLNESLLKGIEQIGYTKPTPIQAAAIPEILKGKDVIGCAQTGTGKTAAFVLPILQRLMEGEARGHIRALILAPTRELVVQSIDQATDLSRFVPIRSAAIYGGVPIQPQIKALQDGVDLVAATPGRLLDHIYSGRIDFVDLSILVLDEVDRMLDMGFMPDIQRILSLLPPERQNLMFSATIPDEEEKLMRRLMRDPVMIEVGRRSAAAHTVAQLLYPVKREKKRELMVHLLRAHPMESVLIFCATKLGSDRLAAELKRDGFSVALIHGDRDQIQRMRALEKFRTGKCQILVATNVAARGLDISDITHVINFDVPQFPEDYVHRIGRTGRAAATGDAITFATPADEEAVRAIEKLLKHPIERKVLEGFAPEAGETAAREPRMRRAGGRPDARPDGRGRRGGGRPRSRRGGRGRGSEGS